MSLQTTKPLVPVDPDLMDVRSEREHERLPGLRQHQMLLPRAVIRQPVSGAARRFTVWTASGHDYQLLTLTN